jgi:hypothetical protein
VSRAASVKVEEDPGLWEATAHADCVAPGDLVAVGTGLVGELLLRGIDRYRRGSSTPCRATSAFCADVHVHMACRRSAVLRS